jgi:putative oxidoreductase
MFKNLLLLRFLPTSADLGLLALRLFAVTPLFLKHGIEKIVGFNAIAGHFPDPLHIGVVPSLLFATLSDALCSVLIVFGLATRWAALFCFINIAVAWAYIHHFQFFGRGADHGELIVLYLAVMATLFLAGAGRFSVDESMGR